MKADERNELTTTSHATHIGGLFWGFILGFYFGRNLIKEKNERKLQRFVLFVGICVALFEFIVIAQWPPRTVFDQIPYCWNVLAWNRTTFGDDELHCVRCQDEECQRKWASMPWTQTVSHSQCRYLYGWDYTSR